VAYRWFRPENIKSIPEMLKNQVEKRGGSAALIYFGKKISYQSLWDLSRRTADIISRNSRLDDRVAIFMPNMPQFVFSYYGALLAERVVVPIDFGSIVNELKIKPTDQIKITKDIADRLTDSRPSLILVADFLYPILRQVTMDWPHKIVVTSPADFLPFPLNWLYPLKAKRGGKYTGPFPKDILNLKSELAQATTYDRRYPHIGAIAQLQYTGGTTGVPKGAVLTHKNLVSDVLQVREHLGDLLKEGEEVTLGALPFFHVYGLTAAMNTTLLGLGGTLVLMPSFDPKSAIKAIDKYQVTLFPGINRMYQKIVEQESLMKQSGLSSLKLCISGGGPIDQSICDKFRELTGTAIVEGYGMSETSPVVSITLPSDIDKPRGQKGNLVGTLLPDVEAKIIDSDGNELLEGEIGTFCVKGPNVMIGYYNKPSETSGVLKNGWFRSGDLCFLAGRDLYFVDRVGDLIKRRGEQIYASHIEKKLIEYPLVAEAVVIGVLDKKDGEVPVACVVLKTSASCSKSQAGSEILEYMKSSSTILQVPSRILIFQSLDEYKTVIGKILKRKLKEEVLKRLQ